MSDPATRPFLKGFSIEEAGAHIQGSCGTLFLPLYLPRACLFEAEVSAPPGGAGPAVRVNGREAVTSAGSRGGATTIRFEAGPEVLRSGLNEVEFCAPRPDTAIVAVTVRSRASGP